MIRHIVLYRFKSDVPSSQIDALFTMLSELKSLVSGIHALEWGAYRSSANKNAGYNYALTVDLEDESVFVAYSPHPLHVQVRQEMAPLLEGNEPLLMFDFILHKK